MKNSIVDFKNIELLLFDLDGTVLDFSAAEYSAFGSLAVFDNLPLKNELFNLYKKSNSRSWLAYERGEISIDELATVRFNEIAVHMQDISAEELGIAYLEAMCCQSQVYDDSHEALSKLSKKFKLSAATNGFHHVQLKRLSNSGLDKYFSSVHTSQNIRHAKPNKKFFDAVLTHHNMDDPQKILMIGDSITSDIDGALAYGMNALHINRGASPCIADHHLCINSLTKIYTLFDIE